MDGSFTIDDSNSFFSPYKILPIAQENKYLGILFLIYHGIVCWMYSLELPHRGNSNEYTQHTIIVLKIKNISLNYRYLFPELVPWLTLSGSNYPYLEWISMVPKMFKPLRVDCIFKPVCWTSSFVNICYNNIISVRLLLWQMFQPQCNYPKNQNTVEPRLLEHQWLVYQD